MGPRKVERDCIGRPGGAFAKGREDNVGLERGSDGSSVASGSAALCNDGDPSRQSSTE